MEMVVLHFRLNRLKFSQRFIQGFSKLATLLTSMLKTTGSFEVWAPKAFGADGNEVVGGGGGADEKVENLSKSRKSKQSTKLSRSSQRGIQASVR